MKFLSPQFLWALGVLAIPVIIHLFNFRRFREVVFPNTRFLQTVQIQSKSKQQLRKILVLLARCLMLAFLVLAFAGPYLPANKNTPAARGHVLSIYIDNSFSMNAVSAEGQLLEAAKSKARELAKSYGSSDRFQLLTNDFEGRHQRLVSREQFLQWVDETDLSPLSRKMSEVYQRQLETLEREREPGINTLAFQISDFQETVADIAGLKGDSLTRLYLLPLKPNSYSNVSVDSVWMPEPYVRPGQTVSLKVRLTNHGADDLEDENITLSVDGKQKGLASFGLPAGKEAEKELNFTVDEKGWHRGSLKIADQPVTFDDELFFAFEAKEHLPVLAINSGESNKYLRGLFATDNYFQYSEQHIQQLDYASIKRQRLIILDQISAVSSGLADELRKFLSDGGTLYLIPPASEQAPETLNSFLTQWGLPAFSSPQQTQLRADKINTRHNVFSPALKKWEKNIEYPSVHRYYPFRQGGGTFESLAALQNGEDIFRIYRKDGGSIYIQNLPLEISWSSFPAHFLFSSALLNMALNSSGTDRLFYTLGEDQLVPLSLPEKSSETLFELRKNEFNMVPEIISRDQQLMLHLGGELKQAGNYDVFYKEAAEAPPLAVLAFNYSRSESASATKSPEKMREQVPPGMDIRILDANPKSTGKTVREEDMGKPLWKWCVILALLFVTIEILLLRFLR
jgi:hypothetical protein